MSLKEYTTSLGNYVLRNCIQATYFGSESNFFNKIFITPTLQYPNQVEKAIFSPRGFLVPNYFCFYLIFLKKLGTKKPLW